MIIISDTTTITNLIHIDLIHLLKDLYQQIFIPKEVYNELAIHHQTLESLAWIEVAEIENQALFETLIIQLDRGESEAIVLALEKQADLLIIDEAEGRRIAKTYNIRIIGLLGILISAKKEGLIDELKTHLDSLMNNFGFRVHPQLYRDILDSVNE